MQRLLATAALSAPFAVALALPLGCASDDPGYAPVGDTIANAPILDDVPANAKYVAEKVGDASFSYPLKKGQPYYVVDAENRTLIASNVADEDGDISIEDGRLMFEGDELADDLDGRRVGLFVQEDLQPVR